MCSPVTVILDLDLPEPGSAGAPPEVRILRLLKFAKRQLGLRCVRVHPACDNDPPNPLARQTTTV